MKNDMYLQHGTLKNIKNISMYKFFFPMDLIIPNIRFLWTNSFKGIFLLNKKLNFPIETDTP